jgi:hypothetical protein
MYSIKLQSNSVTLGASANNIFNAKGAYVSNANTTTGALITQANSTGGQLATFVLPPLGQLEVIKAPTDTLTSNLTSLVFASAAAFTN